MTLLIIESTFMKKIIEKNIKIDKNIKIVATKGHLFSYFLQENKIKEIFKEDKKEIIDFFKNFDKKENNIIIATDQDSAGELIAYEITTFFKNAKIFRFQRPVEEILLYESLKEEYLLKYCITKINILKAVRYLEERFFSNFNQERLKAIKILKKSKITKINFL